VELTGACVALVAMLGGILCERFKVAGLSPSGEIFSTVLISFQIGGRLPDRSSLCMSSIQSPSSSRLD
jgi:hypothetical protein